MKSEADQVRERWPGCEVRMDGPMMFVTLKGNQQGALRCGDVWVVSGVGFESPVGAIEHYLKAKLSDPRTPPSSAAALSVWGVEGRRNSVNMKENA